MTQIVPGPLAGLRVLDLATPLAEPTGRVFADLGAEVIKIEPPGGCASRRTPPFVEGHDADPERSLFWRAFGLGKLSVVLDLDDASDRAAFLTLVEGADVLIESSVPGEMAAVGLDHRSLRALNPMLLYVSVTPYGQSGPDAGSAATDLTLAAAGGFLNCQGDPDRPPVPIGQPEASCGGAVQAAADAILALSERVRSGLGQHIDSSMQAAVAGTLLFGSGYAAFGQDMPGKGDDRADPPLGSIGLNLPVFSRAADGFVGMTLVLGQPGARSLGRMMAWAAEEGGLDTDLAGHDWSAMFSLLGNGTITRGDAQRGIDQLMAFLATQPKAEIHRRGVEGRWLIAPALDAADLLADEQLAARGYWVDVEGTTHPGPFAKLSETPIRYRRPAPRLGEHQHLASDVGREPTVRPPAAPVARRPVFEGLKVADFSWVGAGPLVSRELANLGATVLRVESDSHVDALRMIPPWPDGVPDISRGHSMANFNQSKLGLALDLAVPEARGVALRMIDWADVVVESFVPGTAARHGLDAESVLARRPDVVMLSSSLRGQTGPERYYTGFGLQGAALAGFVAVTGWPDRVPAGPFGAYTDFIAPRYSLAALGAALVHRSRTGQGQYIDLSQIEAAIHYLEPAVLDHVVNGRVAGLRGTDSDRACPHGVYPTVGTERYIAVAVETAAQWEALCAELPAMSVVGGSELGPLSARLARRAELHRALDRACADQEPFALAARLRAAGVAASVVMRSSDLPHDPQLRHRGYFVELDHPAIGVARYDGPVSILSETPHRPTHAGPTIGQHSLEALRDHLGYTLDEISDLAATGALS